MYITLLQVVKIYAICAYSALVEEIWCRFMFKKNFYSINFLYTFVVVEQKCI